MVDDIAMYYAECSESPERLDVLSRHECRQVRKKVASNLKCPLGPLVKLSNDEDPDVRYAAQEKLRSRDVLDELLGE